jgi:Oxidoreductase family, NAD-binding Rossmann fold
MVGHESRGAVVVGTGFGSFTHVRALRAAGFDVLGVVGRDPAKTAERARRFEVPRALTSPTDALELPGVDAVTIATPPHTHAGVALAAIAAGKHVICEKPFARDAAEARTVLAAAEAAGIVHMLGTEFRFDTGHALLAAPSPTAPSASPASPPSFCTSRCWRTRPRRCRLGGRTRTRVAAGSARTAPRSTSGDFGPPIIVTRIVGSRGTAWIEGLGDEVRVADRSGARQLPVPDDLRTKPPGAPPADALHTDYERMIAHGLDLGPYIRLAETFRDRILGRPVDAYPRCRHLRRRGCRHGRARRRAPVGRRGHVGARPRRVGTVRSCPTTRPRSS